MASANDRFYRRLWSSKGVKAYFADYCFSADLRVLQNSRLKSDVPDLRVASNGEMIKLSDSTTTTKGGHNVYYTTKR
jgi:hypothetical protein